ncbi:MAG TPA: monovalent cation/H(+) antiporter subunit G [Phycisphaerales bacterium]|nr:monovalent cation/H(+) antiporter subunit G [Phycisphaerales bacterium]HMP36899.1 monovalent cation/H(+) antiporter subunit G [Phycisphaerales bacterium]
MTLSALATWISNLLLVLGGLASLLAAFSLVRLPDVYTRLHGAAKAGTLGVFTVMTAAGLHFGDHITAIEALVVVVFLFLTAPIATHLVARAARAAGVPMIQAGADSGSTPPPGAAPDAAVRATGAGERDGATRE